LVIFAVLFKNNPFLTVPMQKFVEINQTLAVPIHFSDTQTTTVETGNFEPLSIE
jgi:hypothetical protein